MNKRKSKEEKTTAAPAAAASRAGAPDFELLRELATVAQEFDLSEIEVDGTGRIRIARRSGGVSVATAPAHSAPAHHAPVALASVPAPAPAPAAAPAADPNLVIISSPFVGTFYRKPAPDAQPYVEVGQTIKKGQVVCIVEAMKLMNELEAEADGKVVEILVKDAEHVEYGQPLFKLQKA